MKPKEPREKLFFGLFSAREAFYYPFAIFAVAVCLFYWWAFTTIPTEKAPPVLSPQELAAQTAGQALSRQHTVPLSDTQVLLYDDTDTLTNTWRIYDAVNRTFTDDPGFARAFENNRSAHAGLTNGFSISSFKGNTVLAVESGGSNSPAMIYEWKTNSDRLQTFNWNDFNGNRPGYRFMVPFCALATDNGWLYCIGGGVTRTPIFTTGPGLNPQFAPDPLPVNLTADVIRPCQGGLYANGVNTNTHLLSVYILSQTNLAFLYSNTLIKPPVAFQEFAALPNSSGKQVLWIFFREPLSLKIYNALPKFLKPSDPPRSEFYYYWSDLQVTQFHFITFKKDTAGSMPAWSADGSSVWLPDDKYGVKRYDLK